MTTSGTGRRSSRPGFAAALEAELYDHERVVASNDVDAVDLEVFDGHRLRWHRGLLVVLTTERLLGIPPRGALGATAPFEAALAALTRVVVTDEVAVQLEFADRYGGPGLWRLHVGRVEAVAQRWCHALRAGPGTRPSVSDRV